MARRITLLFITKDFTHRTERSTYYLIQALKKHAELLVWHEHGDIQSILRQCPKTPDFILLNDFKPDYSPFIRNLKSASVPYGIIMHDLKYKMKHRKAFIEKESVRHIFSIYRDPFKKWFPEFLSRMVWLPHHVPINIFKPYNEEKDIDILMSGALFEHIYPLRHHFYTHYKDDPRFCYIPHPGYRDVDEQEAYYVGENYARLLSRAKLFLTCDSVEHFPVLKYYEAAAAGTCLLAPLNAELRDLGFQADENCVDISAVNFEEKVEEYLEDEEKRKQIIQRAVHFIRENHSTEVRAKQLIGHIVKILQSY
ncbi:hypothetical protein GCM10011391_20550 [Pullulanibacillus camelliae]|uniref:Spore protein YkvP/CgeB glycosyl transferase-like domain-containing protein n=1 Tax=Pullulanibacillus camelliae TaxID=1707096 RepID=A0A8J2W0A7_9BACL|nr:glycosyltransferase [Pullulanibacillus camelliae]GGE41681.1 hypothetical protein GCM10011391_20550 [Pullulanibacillus camelliae]